MNCPRCRGLMVYERVLPEYSVVDYLEGVKQATVLHMWKCVNCGRVSEKVIEENKLLQEVQKYVA